MANQERVYNLLQQIPHDGLSAVKELLWTELNYDRANQPLSMRGWPEGIQNALAGPPTLLAAHGDFAVIHGQLAPDQRGVNSPLSLSAERQVINQLKDNHPYALFLFSNRDEAGQEHWHFVNVRYEAEAERRRIFRRITIGPGERLRTASERITLLDVDTIGDRHLGGAGHLPVSPLAIQQAHDDAFDVEAVTRDFFRDYRRIFEAAEASITGLPEAESLRLFTQRLFNRLMFIVFLERKGWMRFDGRTDYLRALWQDHQRRPAEDADQTFYRDRLKHLFFAGLNNQHGVDIVGIKDGFLQTVIGHVPYLNGGLFEEDDLDRAPVDVPDAVLRRALDELFYHYNFTVTESTPLDVEVAVDPEMLGKIFEELVTGRHESGSYYTPKPVVSFMGREALKGYLESACAHESPQTVAAFVDQRDATRLRDPEGVLRALRDVTICDPACGSGAYLVGMLHELLDLRQALFTSRRLDAVTVYDRKLEIIQHNLYGVDIDPFAVNIARLRLWLSLVVDYEGDHPEPLPNLDFKIEVGDSLAGPDPSGGLQPDLFRQQQIKDYFRLKSDYMESHGGDKRTLMREIEALRQEIQAWAHPPGKVTGTSEVPVTWNGFDWVVEFAEVFAAGAGRGGGFDVVLANPPYVRQELLPATYKQRLSAVYPQVYAGTADIFVYFFGRALQLLRPGGMLSFITSNKYFRAGYGEKLRKHLAGETAIRQLIDFGDAPVFNAIAYPSIIVLQKQQPDGNRLQALSWQPGTPVDAFAEVVERDLFSMPQQALTSDGWRLESGEVRRLMEKLRAAGTPLGEYVKGRFYYGIKTGLNAAFVVDRATRDRLIAEHPSSAELLKPFLRGRDVKRWQVEFADKYLIKIESSANVTHPWSGKPAAEAEKTFARLYPTIHRHFQSFRPQLVKRYDQGEYFWELRSCTYWEEFERPKILVPAIVNNAAYAVDTEGYYGNDKTSICVASDVQYLAGLLNSALFWWLIQQTAAARQGGFYEFKPMYVTSLPIAVGRDKQHIETLVQDILDVKCAGPHADVTHLEKQIDALVYDLYGLDDAEIAIVEGG